MINRIETRFTTDYISGSMSLRTPQKKSLEILDSIIKECDILNQDNNEELTKKVHDMYPIFSDFERKFTSLTFALATGVGKTRLMGAFISYLYSNYGIKNFLVIAPSTTIYDKLKADLGYMESEKYVFRGINCFEQMPKLIADDDYLNKNISFYDSDVSIYVYNISKFDKENTKMKAFNETLGMSFYDKLSQMDDLVIIMDESHHYRAEKGMETINNLNPVLGIELTATPIVNEKNKQIPFKNVVYEYSLASAIKDGYTRVPYAVTRTDIDFFNFGDEQLDKLMLSDGIICHKRIKSQLEYYSKTTGKRLVKPFMLVVCKDTEHAKVIEDYIKSNEFENGYYKYKTVTINSKQKGAESDFNTKQLLSVESVDNPIEIVIHVNMLKEGWDVNNLFTIVPLRTATSKILREQMVGRGLRLPYGERTGNREIDSVMLTAHDKFTELINEAKRGDSLFNKENVIKVEDLENERIEITQLSFDNDDNNQINSAIKVGNETEKKELSNKIDKLVQKNVENFIFANSEQEFTRIMASEMKKDIIQELENDKDLAKIFEENRNPLLSWLDDGIIKKHEESISKFILIPKIKTEREEGDYYFEDFDLDLTKFNQKPIENDLLVMNMLDNSDVEKLDAGVINFDAYNPNKVIVEELRKKPEIDYEKYNELLFKLISSLTNHFKSIYSDDGMKNIVMMNKRELSKEIYVQMMKHFVRNEGLIKEEVYSDVAYNIPSNYNFNIKKDLFDSYSSDRDGKITSVLFDGIKKGVFSSAKFDSEPELILARVMENDTNYIKTWLRPSPNQFNITYDNGKRYEPDFVVESTNCIYLIEVKADNQLDDPTVLAKKERALTYCQLVSSWAKETNNKEWKYVIIPASKITQSSTFKHLMDTYYIRNNE